MRLFSFGGGVQSTAALVLASRGKIDYRHFVFANVGDDSENPDTLAYVEAHAKPFAATNDLSLVEVRKKRRDGTPETLLEMLRRSERSIPIPVRMANGAPGNRRCTFEFKVNVIRKYARGVGGKEYPHIIGIGISVDEFHRVRSSDDARFVNDYPLAFSGISRADCLDIIAAAGLPQPPRSSCYFCPFHSIHEWRRLYRESPDLFRKAEALEAELNERRATLGLYQVWLTGHNRPLGEVVNDDQLQLFGDDRTCDSGHCFT